MAVFSPSFSPSMRPFTRPSVQLPTISRPRLLDGPALLLAGLALAFLATLVISAVTGSTGATAASRAPRSGPVVAESAAYPAWTIRGGDTLWSIAQRVAPSADPRAVVLQLQVLNDLAPDADLQPGQVLQLPHEPIG